MDKKQYDQIIDRMERIESMLIQLVSYLADGAEEEELPSKTLDGDDAGSSRNELEPL